MIKSKDFYLLKVYDIKGNYIGIIDDIYINFYKGTIEGFFISNYMFFRKKDFINVNDIISLQEVVIVKKVSGKEGISFKGIKDMEIKDKTTMLKGVLEDLIIEKDGLYIKGLIMSSGIFDKIIKGKEVLLIKDCILGEKFILYNGNTEIKLKSIPKVNKNV